MLHSVQVNKVIPNTTSASGSSSVSGTTFKDRLNALLDQRKPPVPPRASVDDVPPPVPPRIRHLQAPSRAPYRHPPPPPCARSTSHRDEGRVGEVGPGRIAEITVSSTVAGWQRPPSRDHTNTSASSQLDEVPPPLPPKSRHIEASGALHKKQHGLHDPVAPGEKCIIPECTKRGYFDGTVVHRYCSKSHAEEGRRRGIFRPLPPKEKCIIPECTNRRYVKDSVVHRFCSQLHAEEGRRRGIYEPLPPEEKCIIPECTNRRYTEGSVRHQYCSKYHAEEGRRRGIYPSAQDLKDQCDLPNCTRPKAVESNGYKYNYCCRDHALKDGQNMLKSKTEVDAFLKQFPVLKVVRLEENQSAKCGGQLFQRFQSVWKGLNPNQRKTILAFHGTPEKNIQSICTNGFDPSRRSKQQHGPGEYFATTPGVPVKYCQGGKKMLLCELLLGDVNTHHTIHGDIVVMKDPAHDLPRFVVEFS